MAPLLFQSIAIKSGNGWEVVVTMALVASVLVRLATFRGVKMCGCVVPWEGGWGNVKNVGCSRNSAMSGGCVASELGTAQKKDSEPLEVSPSTVFVFGYGVWV